MTYSIIKYTSTSSSSYEYTIIYFSLFLIHECRAGFQIFVINCMLINLFFFTVSLKGIYRSTSVSKVHTFSFVDKLLSKKLHQLIYSPNFIAMLLFTSHSFKKYCWYDGWKIVIHFNLYFPFSPSFLPFLLLLQSCLSLPLSFFNKYFWVLSRYQAMY